MLLLSVTILCYSHLKGVKKHGFFFTKLLDHLILMALYLVIIATDSHQSLLQNVFVQLLNTACVMIIRPEKIQEKPYLRDSIHCTQPLFS